MNRILITGGTGGIGASCVKLLSNEGHNLTFLYNSNSEKANILHKETGAYALKCNLTEPESIETQYKIARSLMTGVDTLVFCAGLSIIAPIQDTADSDWTRLFDVNVQSIRRLITLAIPDMLACGFGKIVIIGSMWGKTGSSCEVAYSATKGAVRAMTMALAKELGPSHITVNCIEPGLIDTPMNSHLRKEDLQELIDQTPIGRIGNPMDVANLVSYLISDKASFITGQCIGVDGGFAV